MKTKILSALAVISLSFSSFGPSHADTIIDEQIATSPVPPDSNVGWVGVNVDDMNRQHMGSFLLAGGSDVTSGGGNLYGSMDDVKKSSSSRYSYNAVIPPCSTSITTDCVEKVQAITANGVALDGTSTGLLSDTDAPTFTGDPKIGFPAGWAPSIWTFPGLSHSGGNQFLVAPFVFLYNNPINATHPTTQLQVNVVPISLKPTTLFNSGPNKWPRISDPTCPLWYAGHQCAVQWPMPINLRMRVVVKLSGSVAGWVHGRLSNPNIQITPNGANGQTFDITGGAVNVPVFTAWKKYSEISPALKAILLSQTDPRAGTIWPDNARGTVWDGTYPVPFTKITVEHDLSNYDTEDFTEFVQWLAESDNKSVATKSTWAFYTANPGRTGAIDNSPCAALSDGVSGVVSSNSTMYLAAPPVFNSSTGTLEYQVAAPHFDRNNNVNTGTYDLLLNSKVARCLYNFTNAPIKASVSMVSTDGTTQAATSVLSETNGWLHLAVAGFTYSSPTIQVKLSQDAPAAVATPTPVITPTPEPTASAAPTTPPVAPAPKPTVAAKKITITCVKGKTTKTVTAVKPTCPTGYKKK